MLVLAYGRPVMRAAALLALLLLVPGAAALGEVVDLTGVSPPERTMAGKPFVVEVTLVNHAAQAKSVVLLGALYGRAAPECGPATDPAFKQFTHLVQENLTLAAGERRTVHGWAQSYRKESVTAAPAMAEWCVFVAEDAGQRLDYLDYQSAPLSVRGANAKPTATLSWLPERPFEAQDVQFVAEGQDADGDPVTFSWDFGHLNASGKQEVTGDVATHFYYPAGRYTVTLTASDGLEETTVTREVEVAPEPTTTSPTVEQRDDAPLPLILPLAALGAAAWARARRSRCR